MHVHVCMHITLLDLLQVLGATLDGNSVNRRLIKLHDQKLKLLHKTTNPFSSEPRAFFFFSDPPHYMKTVRNCMISKARMLWVSHITYYILYVVGECS